MDAVELPAVRQTDWSESHYWRRKRELELHPDEDFQNSVREFIKLAAHPSIGPQAVFRGLEDLGATANINDLFPRDGLIPNEDAILQLLLRSKAEAEWGKELLFEDIRAAEFPLLPSRRRALFLFEIGQDPLQFMERMQFSHSDRFLVETEDLPGSRIHKADFRLLDCNVKPRNERIRCAREYWAGMPVSANDIEILLEGPFRIVRVDLPPVITPKPTKLSPVPSGARLDGGG